MANEAKIEAAAAVLEAMGGADVTVEIPTEEVKVEKVKKAIKKVKDAAKKETKKAKVKKPEPPKRPGPKTVAVEFPSNTKHKTADGGEIEIEKVRVSYLVKLPGGRLKWFSSLKVKAMVESQSAAAAEVEEAAAAVAA